MSYYLLADIIQPCTAEELPARKDCKYVAVLTTPEWAQNRIMTLLTIVTTIFMPLTLIAGWYGMNFRYMPELEWRIGYPIVIGVSILIVVFCLLLFKKKKWL